MATEAYPRTWKIVLAFTIIYFVWGSTFLAIRVGVAEVPPFLLAAMRFLIAGVVVFWWVRARGTPFLTVREWGSATLLAVFMTLSEILIMKTQRLTLRLAGALLVGTAGVAVLVSRSASFGDAPIDAIGAGALIVAAI